MNDQFQVWVLLLGIACGATIAWLAFTSVGAAADPDLYETRDERALEARWLADELGRQGQSVDPDALEAALVLDRDLAAGRFRPRLPPVDVAERDAAPAPAGNPAAAPAGNPAAAPRTEPMAAPEGTRAGAGRPAPSGSSVRADEDRLPD